MDKRVVVQKELYPQIVSAYQDEHRPAAEIASWLHISRQGVYKILNRCGVDTRKHKVEVPCSYCDKPIMRTRGRLRSRVNHFCDQGCYYEYLRITGVYVPSRSGQRLARYKIGEVFELKEGYVVHHEDKNCLNNQYRNLRVFACNGDHVKYHRTGKPEPIWDGREVEGGWAERY